MRSIDTVKVSCVIIEAEMASVGRARHDISLHGSFPDMDNAIVHACYYSLNIS